jgi:uncharacterized protein
MERPLMERPILVEPTTLAGIPVLHVRARHLPEPAPTILFYHGWSSCKENNGINAEALACEGFRVIVPDAVHHGVRGALADYNTAQTLPLFWPTIIQSVEEAALLHQAAVAAGWADPGRMGVAGHSMGGFISSGIMAKFPWVKAGVLLNGCPSYVFAGHMYAQAAHMEADEALLAQLAPYDPIGQVERIAPRSLLLLHGEADQVVPPVLARRFCEAARPYYAEHPERLVLTEIRRLNHYITSRMIMQMRDWFVRYL